MPEPQAHPEYRTILRVARRAMIAALVILAMKIVVFVLTDSAAVLSDALESIINIAAAALMLYGVWLSNRPADKDHPYGHGKVEYMIAALEGWMILIAGVVIVVESVRRLIGGVEPNAARLDMGLMLLGAISVLTLVLAVYVYANGKRFESVTLIADGKHLFTDVASTVGVVVGLLLVRATGKFWLDPVVALIIAGPIFFTSWRLLWKSIDGLMDRRDPDDDRTLRAILDEETKNGAIHGYHKLRHRHSGRFHWVDMHLHVDGDMNVAAAHELASRIEHRIEQALGACNATAHVEPADPTPGDEPVDEGL
jgi:cation diffusion facilitator family transporter